MTDLLWNEKKTDPCGAQRASDAADTRRKGGDGPSFSVEYFIKLQPGKLGRKTAPAGGGWPSHSDPIG